MPRLLDLRDRSWTEHRARHKPLAVATNGDTGWKYELAGCEFNWGTAAGRNAEYASHGRIDEAQTPLQPTLFDELDDVDAPVRSGAEADDRGEPVGVTLARTRGGGFGVA